MSQNKKIAKSAKVLFSVFEIKTVQKKQLKNLIHMVTRGLFLFSTRDIIQAGGMF